MIVSYFKGKIEIILQMISNFGSDPESKLSVSMSTYWTTLSFIAFSSFISDIVGNKLFLIDNRLAWNLSTP